MEKREEIKWEGGMKKRRKTALQQASVLLLILSHKHILYVEAHTLSVQSTYQISFVFLHLFCLCHEHNSS